VAGTKKELLVMVSKAISVDFAQDPLSEFREIKDLIVIGPAEWKKAVRGGGHKNRNPLWLSQNWCPCPQVPYSVEQMRQLVELSKAPEWNTRVVLWLALPKVGGVLTSLMGQSELWGVAHDNLVGGQVRSDPFWSNWFVEHRYPCALEPAVTEPTCLVGYELPRWTIMYCFSYQQKLARDREMSIMTASQYALMCNLLAINGVWFHKRTWSRTSSIIDGCPLSVGWYSEYGLDIDWRWWIPMGVDSRVGASVEGVPF